MVKNKVSRLKTHLSNFFCILPLAFLFILAKVSNFFHKTREEKILEIKATTKKMKYTQFTSHCSNLADTAIEKMDKHSASKPLVLGLALELQEKSFFRKRSLEKKFN